MKRAGRIVWKIAVWVAGLLIALILLSYILIRLPAVQNILRKKAVAFLEERIGTDVEVGRILITFPNAVLIEDVYFADQQGDTLFAGEKLLTDIRIWKLVRNKVDIRNVEVEGITANIHRNMDSIFNFQYIIDAFATSSEPATDAKPMQISLDKISLQRVAVRYADDPDAINAQLNLGALDVDIDRFDLEKQEYAVSSIVLKNTKGSFIQKEPLAERESATEDMQEASEPIPFDVQLGSIDVENVSLVYQNAVSGIDAKSDIGTLFVEAQQINLAGKEIYLKEIRMNDSDLRLAMGGTSNAQVVKEEAQKEIATQSEVWSASLQKLSLENNSIAYDDQSVPVAKDGLDFGHLGIVNLSLKATDLSYVEEEIGAKVEAFSFTEKSGFGLKRLQGELFLGYNHAYAKGLSLETNASTLKTDAALKYNSLDSISYALDKLQQEITIQNSTLAMSEILFLSPELREEPFFKTIADETVNIDAKIEGTLGDLRIAHLNFSGLSHTELNASGTVKGLPEVEGTTFDLQIRDFHTTRSDLNAFLPTGTLPDNIEIPQDINLAGSFRGTMDVFDADLNARTSFGNAVLDGRLNTNEPMQFTGSLSMDDFEIGKVLKQDTVFGAMSGSVTADLRNITSSQITGTFSGEIDAFPYNGYTYKDLKFEGDANAGIVTLTAGMDDPNLQFALDGSGTMSSAPSLDFKLDLGEANLQALGFLDRPVSLSGIVYGNLGSIDPDSLDGTVAFSNLVVKDSAQTVQLDTLFILSSVSPEKDSLQIKTDFADILMTGDFTVAGVFPALASTIAEYTGFGADTVVSIRQHQFDLTGQISYSPILTQFDSSLKAFDPIAITGNYQSTDDALNLTLATPLIRYDEAVILNTNFEASTKNQALTYQLSLDEIRSGDLKLRKPTIKGDAQNGVINTELIILDSLDKERFHLLAQTKQTADGFSVSLQPNPLRLNYDQWNVSNDNEITIGDGTLAVRNLLLSNNAQSMSIRSEPYGPNNPIKLEFDQFRIETISEMINGDSLLAGGTIDGTATLRNYFSSPVFIADLQISDLSYRGDTIGNVTMNIDNQTANTLAAKMTIEGEGNRANLEGTYVISSEQINLRLNLERLQLASIQGFSFGEITNASGSIRGDLEIKGKLFEPVVEGDLHFDSASVKITQLNSQYTLANEGIRFTNSDIHFNQFTITDVEGNTLNFNGQILTKTFTNFRFALDITSRNFKVLDTQAQGNDLYYGTLYLDSNIRIRGGINDPEVNADLTILDKTNMTVIIPQTAPGLVEREGVVRFVDLENPDLDSILTVNLDSLNSSDIRGIVAFANIKVTDASEFKLVIDQGTGDFIRLRGNAELNASLDPSGKISMTGTYVLEEGIYELSFNFLKRRFEIRKGSTITWNGEPTSGIIDITGVYIVEAAPIDLVERQLADATPAELNLYKEKLPFQLLLSLTGTLIKPIVEFDIELPEGNYPVSPEIITTVQARLAQLSREESEVNKQAFALVLLNRFISDDPFRSAAGGASAESYARQSVSKLLSQQLNDFTANLISGVDLNFDLESSEDYSTGQLQNRTDLNVSASKRLFDDRITVTVGSNFELEGTQQTNEKANNIAGDISIDYQLSKDGRYLLRAYRKNEYEVAVEGHVIETGLSFIIQLDYDRFVEIFQRESKSKSQ